MKELEGFDVLVKICYLDLSSVIVFLLGSVFGRFGYFGWGCYGNFFLVFKE